MRKKHPASFSQKFPKADPMALQLLRRLLAFDPKDRPSAEEACIANYLLWIVYLTETNNVFTVLCWWLCPQALADPYFNGLAKVEREPTCQPIPKMEFEFERRRVTKEDIKELIFREILEYHPKLLNEYTSGTQRPNYLHLRLWICYTYAVGLLPNYWNSNAKWNFRVQIIFVTLPILLLLSGAVLISDAFFYIFLVTVLLTSSGNNLPNWMKMAAEVDYWRQYRGNMLLCQGNFGLIFCYLLHSIIIYIIYVGT
jgi:hypothetical protein